MELREVEQSTPDFGELFSEVASQTLWTVEQGKPQNLQRPQRNAPRQPHEGVKVYPGLWGQLESGDFAKDLQPHEIGPAAIDLLLRSIFRGPGRYSPSNVELLLLGTRGGCWHPNTGFKPRQVVLEAHPRDTLTGKIRHSRKPEVFQDELDRWLRPHAQGPFLELFATRRRPGWNCLGHALTQTDIRDDLQGLAGQGSLFATDIEQNSEEAPCPNALP